MTKEEFQQIAKGLRAAYRQNDFLATGEALGVWFTLLEDLDYKTTLKAVQRHIQSSTYPPTIADIRNNHEDIMSSEREYKSQLREIYDFTKGVYPCSEDTKTARVTWSSIVNKGETWTEKINMAVKLRNATVHFVEEAERSGFVNTIPTFEEYLKEISA